MEKILIVTPHLSTGGLPQFLLDKIYALKAEYQIFLVEWINLSGDVFVVQKNKIKNLLKDNFYSLSDNKNEIFDIIDEIHPNIIHFEEFVESFIDNSILEKIYNNDNYFITETTHGTLFNSNDKEFFADKLMFVSDYNYNQYHELTEESEVIKFPSKYKKREEILEKLNLDIDFKHVLNIGLFNSNKNQKEIFDYAESLKDEKIIFHFIGNQADNFSEYWKPIIDNKPENCKIWGELENVADFYNSMDLFLYTSLLENRPLSIMEALNSNIPILMYNLHNYGSDFSRYESIDFLTHNYNDNISLILSKLNIKKAKDLQNIPTYNINAYHILTDIDSDREVRSIQSLSKLKDNGIGYNMVISKRYTEIPPKETCAFPDIISLEPGGKLTPAHYGCYLGHRKAFYKALENDPDYMLICECDCIISLYHDEFVKKLNEACFLIERDDLLLFSMGYHSDQGILYEEDEYFIIDHFIGAHCYLIPRKSYDIIKNLYENEKWNVTDLFLANNLKRYNQGIFKNPITKQAAGISILENKENDDRY